jgi:hypothetical protein
MGTECQSGKCVDGVCCNSDCTGPCVTCNQPQALGTCTIVGTVGADPRSMCPAAAGNDANCKPGGCSGTANSCLTLPAGTACGGSCNNNTPTRMTCNATGQCSTSVTDAQCAVCKTCVAGTTSAACSGNAPTSTLCAQGYCGNINTAYPPAYCDGAGNCNPQSAQSCGRYTCYGQGSCYVNCGTCNYCYPSGSCTGPIDSRCVSGSCNPTCSASPSCSTTYCLAQFHFCN